MLDFIETKYHGKARVEQDSQFENRFSIHFPNGATYNVENENGRWRNLGKTTKLDSIPDIDLNMIEIGKLIDFVLKK